MSIRQVYADVLQQCNAIAAPRRWSRFAKGFELWRMPTAHHSIWESLKSNHDAEILLRSGVADDVDGKLVFNLPLSTISGSILALRDGPNEPPFDLLTEQGSVRGKLPIRSAVEDFRLRVAIEETGRVFAAFEFGDVIRLRSIGLAAAPATGLESFTLDSLRRFRFVFGALNQKPSAVPHSLTLVGWNLARFTAYRSQSVDQIIASLAGHSACLGLALHRIAVWLPSRAALRDLSTCLRCGRRQDLVAAVIGSLERDRHSLVSDPNEPDPRDNMIECERRLKKALMSNDASPKRRRQALERFQRALATQIVAPLLMTAQEETNHREGLRLRSIADVARTTLFASTVQRIKLEKAIVEDGLSSDAASFDFRSTQQGYATLFRLLDEGE